MHQVHLRGSGGSAHGLSSPRDADWREQAACRNYDPEIWHPLGLDQPGLMSPATAAAVDLAKAVCRRCPVADRCRDWAISSGERHGVWGGMTPRERNDYANATGVIR